MRRGTTLTLLGIAFAACTEAGGEAAAAFSVRDSAGIQIAESAGPAWGEGEAWQVSDTAEVEIGMADGPEEYLLSGVNSVVRGPDGGIVLVNGGSQQIRFYDVEGRHVRSVGGRGGGPGEFQQIFWVKRIRGDTLVAYDFPARRISVLSPEGSFVRAVTLDELGSFPNVLPALSNGSLIVQVRQNDDRMGEGSGITSEVTRFLHASAEGAVLDTVFVAPPRQQYQVTREAGNGAIMTTVMPMLFGPATLSAVAGDSVFLGSSDRYEVGVYSPTGELRRIVRRLIDPVPVTEEHLAAAARESARLMSNMNNEESRELFRQAREDRPHAQTLPFFTRILVDEPGNVWVMEFTLPETEGPAPWTVFDREGRMLGTLAFPDGFTPAYIGDDFVLGVARDELDVQRVRLHAIRKPSGA